MSTPQAVKSLVDLEVQRGRRQKHLTTVFWVKQAMAFINYTSVALGLHDDASCIG